MKKLPPEGRSVWHDSEEIGLRLEANAMLGRTTAPALVAFLCRHILEARAQNAPRKRGLTGLSEPQPAGATTTGRGPTE